MNLEMKKILIICVVLFGIWILTMPRLFSQTIYLQGTISTDTLLIADTVKVTGDITILNGVTLSVIQGAFVEFQGWFKINVQGRLLAEGNINDTIVFAVRDTTGFSDTSVVNGGWHGIHFDNTPNSNDTSKIIYCKLQFGKARGAFVTDYAGGVVYIMNFSKVHLANSTFSNNVATMYGGAVYCGQFSSPLIENCLFKKNRTFYYGGGVYIGANSNARILGNTFIMNTAYRKWLIFSSGVGGGICSSSADLNSYCPIITGNSFFNNKSIGGAGIYESNYHITIVNNLVCNNHGGGILSGHQLGQEIYTNNTICNNSMFGGIECYSWYSTFANNIIWGNTNVDSSTNQINIMLNANPIVKYCDIEYGYPGEGNINVLPLFIQPTNGAGLNFNGFDADWSLQDHSPCIDSGTPDTLGLELPGKDIVGNPRISYFRVDIGAYEKLFPTGVNDKQPSEIKIYPNPATDIITIETPFSGSLFILNSNGQQLFTYQTTERRTQIDISPLPNGIFFVRLKGEKTEKTVKFIKEPL